jgi:peptide/nickel transport system permease protein
VIYGARVALLVGLLATSIAMPIGVIIGAVAGYFGGTVDGALSRLIDAVMAFPLLALLLALAVVLRPSLVTVVVIIGSTVWAPYARVARADVLSLREREFVLAARACGASSARIIFRHIAPNIMGPIIVLATLGIGGIIILESALSFLGLGVQPPTPAWGSMLSDSRAYLRYYPHLAVPPGIMITLTVIAFNLVGDGLRDAFDPRLGKDR